jgi:O-antigen/teichoic acid export membrane protein
VTISLIGLGFLWLGQPLVVVVSAYAISGLVYLLVAALVVTGRYGLAKFPGWEYVMRVLWVGLPFALEPLVFVLYSRADIVMLRSFLGDHAAGIYAFPYRVLEMSGVCFSLYGTALYPVFARLYQSDRQELARVFRTSRMVIFVLASLAMLTLLLGSGMGIRMLFQDKFAESIVVFKLMSCFALTNSLRYLYFPLLLASNGQRYCLIVAVIVTVLNVGMNAIMIPLWGVMGAVVATLCSEIVYLVVYDLAASKIVEDSVNVPRMLTAAVVLAIPVAVGLGMLQWFAVVPTVLSAWIIFLGLVFGTGMVEFGRVNELFALVRVYPR